MSEAAVKDISLNPDEGIEAKIGQATKYLKDQLAAKTNENAQLRKVAIDRDAAARKAQGELMQAAHYATRTEHSAIANALAEADTRSAALKSQLAAAIEVADGKAAAEIQVQIADIAARRLLLQQGKDRIEEEIEADKRRAEAAARQPPPQPQRPALPADPFEAALVGLNPADQAWLRQHKDKGYIRPGRAQVASDKLLDAAESANKAGLQPGSPQFLQHMDRVLGHTRPDAAAEDASQRFVEAPRQPQQQQRRPVPAAPPTRAAGGNATPTRNFRLTPAEASTAERLGMTPQQYRQFQEVAVERGKLPASYLNNR